VTGEKKKDDHHVIYFCPKCGSDRLEIRIPRLDDKRRQVCVECNYVHYTGPALAAGVILHGEAGICLARRALEPGRGLWAFPGGFVDLDEEPEAAALREAEEETGHTAEVERLVGVYNSLGPRGKRVLIVVYSGRATGRAARKHEGPDEVQEVRWFPLDEIPWAELAFESTRLALREYLGLSRG
jgi:ADP-ribose pyrophosphatase YjhB (NUDIX family)